MGNEFLIQICQFTGGEFPNEKNMDRFQIFPIKKIMPENELKDYIRANYGYCVCRQKIYIKESKEIEKKYPIPENINKQRIYVSISEDKNCKCAFFSIQKLRNELLNDFKKLQKEKNELMKIEKDKSKELDKIKNNIKKIKNNFDVIKEYG